MNRYLLDTNVISELRKPRPHGAVVSWIGKQLDEQLFISSVTLGEVQAGIERLRHQDAQKATEIDHWLDQVAASYQVLAMDANCFLEWGRLVYQKPDPLLEDAMIAATARIHGLIVVTRNERDFSQLGVHCLNPFKTT